MAIATGVQKQIKYKVESTYGVAPAAGSAQLLRRVSSDLNLTKDTYQSNEIRTDYQISDFRHGAKAVGGTINGELSPGTYKDFIAASLRQPWQTAISDATISGTLVIANSGTVNSTITRTGGSWYVGNKFKVGDIVALTAGTVATVASANLNIRFQILSFTSATIMAVRPISGVQLTAQTIDTGTGTIAQIGKKTFIPTTGHTDLSYSIEHWFNLTGSPDYSEVFTGCKVSQIDIGLPATGMATCNVGFMGQDLTTSTSEYFTSPLSQTTTSTLTSSSGLIRVANVTIATITGLTVTINNNLTSEAVVGSNTKVEPFIGRVLVTGQLTAFFEDSSLRDYFLNETEVSIIATLTANNTGTSDFITLVLPRVKMGGASKDDGDKGIVQTLPFTALSDVLGGDGLTSLATTISIQDSQA